MNRHFETLHGSRPTDGYRSGVACGLLPMITRHRQARMPCGSRATPRARTRGAGRRAGRGAVAAEGRRRAVAMVAASRAAVAARARDAACACCSARRTHVPRAGARTGSVPRVCATLGEEAADRQVKAASRGAYLPGPGRTTTVRVEGRPDRCLGPTINEATSSADPWASVLSA
jgi:hypothetical protein